jgi:hypothetical protein
MTGTVTVAAAPPPAVPDGVSGGPLLVQKLVADGSSLRLTWDDTTCGSTEHQVIVGFGAQLPSVLGGVYGLQDGLGPCGVGASPFTWVGVPDPSADPEKLLWFLMLANDGATTEGSWGQHSAEGERTGPVAGGSGQCGTNAKSLSNTCGQ